MFYFYLIIALALLVIFHNNSLFELIQNTLRLIPSRMRGNKIVIIRRKIRLQKYHTKQQKKIQITEQRKVI